MVPCLQMTDNSTWRTVVGVVDRVPNQQVHEEVRPMVYLPQSQAHLGAVQVIVRGPASPATPATIRAAFKELDPAVSVTPVIPLAD